MFYKNKIWGKSTVQRMKSALNRAFYRYIYFVQKKKILYKLSVPNVRKDIEWEIKDLNPEEFFEFKDESWNPIKNIWEIAFSERIGVRKDYEDNICLNSRVVFEKHEIVVNSRETKSNRWVFLKAKQFLGDIYAIEFYVTLNSEFTELQFAFNYESIMKRVRFMLEDNRNLVFGIVDKGSFFNLKSNPLHIELGAVSTIRIEIIENSFYYFVNTKLVQSVQVPARYEARSKQCCAFIFWEKDNTRPIDAVLQNIQIFSGKVNLLEP